MEVVKCSKGHYYDKSFMEACPVCTLGMRLDSVSLDDLDRPTVRLVQCPRGHYYASSEAGCPICIAEENAISSKTEIRNDPLADFSEPENTMVFVAFGNLSCQLRIREGSYRVLLRQRLPDPPITLQEELEIPRQDARNAGREILEILIRHRNEGAFAGLASGQGNCRLYFNTRQLSCDHRWQQGDNGSLENCAEEVKNVLCGLFARHQDRLCDASAERENRLAEIECGRLNLMLGKAGSGISLVQTPDGWKEADWVLRLQSEIYYRFTSSVVLRESVKVPSDDARELLNWLGRCGVMEALLGANQRPNDGPCIDPGVATVFHLQTGDLTYSYRDWNKRHTSEEAKLLDNAMNHMLEVYMRCRPEERK